MVSEFGKSKNKVFDVKNKELFFFNSELLQERKDALIQCYNKENYSITTQGNLYYGHCTRVN